jgi:hypothetical protein
VAGGGGGTKIVEILTGPSGNFPNTPTKNVYYTRVHTPSFPATEWFPISGTAYVTLTPTSEYIYVGNFRSNIVVAGQFYEANKINGKYYIDNQAVFL